MGICGSRADDTGSLQISKDIERSIKEEIKVGRIATKSEIKLLLLGAPESGKSTIFKQMKVYYGMSWSDEEVKKYRSTIRENLFSCTLKLIKAMDSLKIPYGFDIFVSSEGTLSDENINSFTLKNSSIKTSLSSNNISLKPYEDPFVECASLIYHRYGGKYRQEGEAPYAATFLLSVDLLRILEFNYVPTTQDILECQKETRTIEHLFFKVGKLTVRVFDVGGLRSKRHVWMPYFDT
ncbi:Guanine nucleotide-binding protein G(k) subunit alpha, partial [Physocladia obscura]